MQVWRWDGFFDSLLNTYLLELVNREVATPTVAAVLQRAARRTERATGSAVQAVAAARDEHGALAGLRLGDPPARPSAQ